MRDLREIKMNEGGLPVQTAQPRDDQVVEFEETFGVRLPEDYLILLRHSNGGGPELNAFRPKGAQDDTLWGVNRFYRITSNKQDIEGLWRSTKEFQAGTSLHVVPIANDGGGNQIVLSYERSLPSVKVCIHDEDFRMLEVADTFSDFIDMLQEDPDMI